MAGFWDLSDNTQVEAKEEYVAPSGGGDYFFPHNSKINGIIDEMKWDSFNGGEEFIKYRISVVGPKTDADGVKIENRKLFLKLWINGDEKNANGNADKVKKKADNAKRMLASMDANAGGKLMKLGRKPTDEDLAACMLMSPMQFSIGHYEFYEQDGSGKPLDGKQGRRLEVKNQGNYILGVGKYNPALPPVEGQKKAVQSDVGQKTVDGYEVDDSIPF